MNPNQDFNRLYADITENIASAMNEIADLKVAHTDGKKELSSMMEKLREIQTRFSDELTMLKEYSEWDKFTIAFFGETNAGKSTIIESLRILFKEESRAKLLQESGQDLEKFEKSVVEHASQVQRALSRVYAEHAAQIVDVRQRIVGLSKVLEQESSRRIKLQQEMLQKEASERLQVLQLEVSARVTRKLFLSAFGGCVLGAVLASVIFLFGRM